MYQVFNYIKVEELDYTHQYSIKSIDLIAASPNILELMEGSQLFKIEEIVNTDYQGFVIYINLEKHFEEEFSSWDQIEKRMLDPNKRSYKKKFDKIIEKLLDTIPIEIVFDKIIEYGITNKRLEQLDKDITFLLKKIRKKIEEQNRKIPYLKEKVKRIAIA